MGAATGEAGERFGPFLLVRQLGVGGMGTAYLARHAKWAGPLVVKRMHAQLLTDATALKRFIHEAKVASFVRHPNVAQMVAMGAVGPEPFFATEFIGGPAVSELVVALESRRAPRPEAQVALTIARDVLAGLVAVHDACDVDTGEPLGLIHRDLSARNVLVGFDGRARIIDLGLGKSILADWQTATNVVSGSPDYFPPEQAVGERVDRRADVYAAAVVVWEILVGKKRIQEPTVSRRLQAAVTAVPEPLCKFRPELTVELERALKRAMEPDPNQRTPTARLLLDALDKELTRHGGADPRRVSAWLEQAFPKEHERHRAMIAELEENTMVTQVADETRIYAAHPAVLGSSAAALATATPPEAEPPTEEARPDLSLRETLEDPPTPPPAVRLRAMTRAAWRDLRAQPRPIQALLGLSSLLVVSLCGWIVIAPAPAEIEPLPAAPAPRPEAPSPPEAPPTPAPRPAPPPPEPEAPERPPVVEERPAPKRPARLAPELEEQKRRVAERLKTLRRRNFEAAFQRRLTALGQRLSDARSREAIDAVDAEVRRLERD